MNPRNEAQLDKMTPEMRAKAEKAMARNNTPEARARFEAGKEAAEREIAETGTIATARGDLAAGLAELGRRLRETREARGVKVDDLANAAGIERSHVYKLENGKLPNPTVATLERYARGLGGRLEIAIVPEEEASRRGGSGSSTILPPIQLGRPVEQAEAGGEE